MPSFEFVVEKDAVKFKQSVNDLINNYHFLVVGSGVNSSTSEYYCMLYSPNSGGNSKYERNESLSCKEVTQIERNTLDYLLSQKIKKKDIADMMCLSIPELNKLIKEYRSS